MKILIVGCGKIGSTILGSLVTEGHDVVTIDTNADVITEMSNVHDVMGVCGNGADCEVLTEAGVEDAELVVAVTGSDELNMLSCFLARRMGARHTIARIRNPEYNDKSLSFMRQQLQLSMAINPDMMAAHELYNILKLPSAAKVETFSRRSFEMVEMVVKPDSKMLGVQLWELRKKFNAKFLICAVQRGEEVFIPDGNFSLQAGDKIGLTAAPNEIQKLLKLLGIMKKQARSAMILGGSRTAYYLSKMLLGSGTAVKIIEQDRKRCHMLSEELPDAVIINGDGAQQELLMEEGLKDMDAFVALTGMDEENILIASFAMLQLVPKIITKVNRDELAAIADRLGLESIISPRKIIADVVVRYARALQNSVDSKMETLYKLMDGKAEAMEFNVLTESEITNKSLSELRVKPGILIAGILRGRRPIIPTGTDMILPGDNVVVIAQERSVRDLADILQQK